MRRHRKKRWKHLVPLLSLLLLGLAIVEFRYAYPTISLTDIRDIFQYQQVASKEYGWNLMLVNREHYIPDDYTVDLTELSNGQKVDSRIYPSLQEMFDSARAEGLGLFVADGYRTKETQQQILDEKIEAYKSDGYSNEEAEKKAEEWVAVPGTSEHQLGLAVDINADKTQSSSDEVYRWLAENAYKYGFIQRYPENKTDITGTIYEPWHYRYVGKDASYEIYAKGLCLEEYIEKLD